jgi:hypothetical protein
MPDRRKRTRDRKREKALQDVRDRQHPAAPEMIRMAREGCRLPVIAERFSLSKSRVSQVLKACGVDSDYYKTVDHDFFGPVDTEAKAYWLGFLVADGCIFDNAVLLSLQAGDVEHIEKFRRDIGSTHSVAVRDQPPNKLVKIARPTAFFRVRSSRMVSDLAKCGVVPRKSLIVEPWDGPAELMRHYWRGVIDGDGWICNRTNPAVGTSIGLCGSSGVVTAFAAYVESLTGVCRSVRQTGKIWRYDVASHAARKVIHHLYRGATVYLTRKKALADIAVGTTTRITSIAGLERQILRAGTPRLTCFGRATRDSLLEAFNRLGSWKAVADEMGVCYATLKSYKTERYHIYSRRHDGKPADVAHGGKCSSTPIPHLDELRRQLGTWRAVARHLGVTFSTVHRRRRMAKLQDDGTVRVDQ